MKEIRFRAKDLSKEFSRRRIFGGISFSLASSDSLAVTGRNGSGKSTLAKILCGLLAPTGGEVACAVDGVEVPPWKLHRHVGLVAPYINMYDEFTGLENLTLIGRLRCLGSDYYAEAEGLLRQFGVFERRNDDVRTYSSGMKQRLKYAAALLHHPEVLILDEPTSNLDEEGVSRVHDIMRSQVREGVLIVATNDVGDFGFATQRLDLNLQPSPP